MTKWSITHAQFTFTAIILIIIAGAMAYFQMPRAEDPAYIVRTARVTTLFPGASAERVENLVTDPLEEAIQEIPELDYIKSESRTGISQIDVYIKEKYKDIRPIWDNLRRKINRVRPTLPPEVIGPDVNDEFGDVYGTLISLTGDGYSYADLKDIADDMRDELIALKDVGRVQIWGVQDERLYVEYNEAKLAEFGLSAPELRQILTERNIVLPGGTVSNQVERTFVEPSGNFETLEDLQNSVIRLPSGATIYLKDIATIKPGYVEPRYQGFRYHGERGLTLAVSLIKGGNIIRLGEEVDKVVNLFRTTYPIGIQLDYFAQQANIVKRIIGDFSINLLQAVVFVTLIVLLALGFRTGLMVASVIPTAILATFLVMLLWGISLDQISLAALVISLGLLVDNSICVNEGCLVLIAEGVDPTEAAIATCAELKKPLLISSLTTAAAFLPIYLAKSAAGEYTQSIFQVVAVALITSWVLAMTMSPLLVSKFVKKTERKSTSDSLMKILGPYERLLHFVLSHRLITMVISCGILVLGFVGLHFVDDSFFPSNDRPVLTVGLEMPAGTKFEMTDAMALKLEKFLAKQEKVIDWAVYTGTPAPRFVLTYSPENARPEYAFFIINTFDDRSATELERDIQKFAHNELLDARLKIRRLEFGPAVSYPIEIRLSGRDYDKLALIAEEVKAKLETLPEAENVHDNWGRWSKKIVVDVDQPKALRAGVSSQDVANSLQTYLRGFETSKFRRDEDLIPIVLRSEEPDRENAENLLGLSIFGQEKTVVPLEQVAKIDTVWEPARIHRRDTVQTISVQADLKEGEPVSSVLDVMVPWLKKQEKIWPPGFSFAIGGEKEESLKASKSIWVMLPIAVLAIILLLMSHFNSIRKVAAILLLIPFALVGVAVGLLITGYPLGFVTFLGIIALAGMVINTGVVLLDRIRIETEKGTDPYDAIITACKVRLRPIILTLVTTVAGMLPLAYGGGPMFSPMAVAIISGLLFNTALALLILPTLYSIFFKISRA